MASTSIPSTNGNFAAPLKVSDPAFKPQDVIPQPTPAKPEKRVTPATMERIEKAVPVNPQRAQVIPYTVDTHKQKRTLGMWGFLLFPLAIVAGVATHGSALAILSALGGFFNGYNRGRMNYAAMKHQEFRDALDQTYANAQLEHNAYMRTMAERRLNNEERLIQLREEGKKFKNPVMSDAKGLSQAAQLLVAQGNFVDRIQQLRDDPGLLSHYMQHVQKMVSAPDFAWRSAYIENYLSRKYPALAKDPALLDSLIQETAKAFPDGEWKDIQKQVQMGSPNQIDEFWKGNLPPKYANLNSRIQNALDHAMDQLEIASRVGQEESQSDAAVAEDEGAQVPPLPTSGEAAPEPTPTPPPQPAPLPSQQRAAPQETAPASGIDRLFDRLDGGAEYKNE